MILRVAFSTVLIEIVLRLTSTYTLILYNTHFTGYFSTTSIVTALFVKGALFTAKYIVYYGMTTVFNALVGMKTTQLPRCICLMHLNSEMWRLIKRKS